MMTDIAADEYERLFMRVQGKKEDTTESEGGKNRTGNAPCKGADPVALKMLNKEQFNTLKHRDFAMQTITIKCASCGQEKWIGHYSYNAFHPSKWKVICIECRRLHERIRYQKDKAREAKRPKVYKVEQKPVKPAKTWADKVKAKVATVPCAHCGSVAPTDRRSVRDKNNPDLFISLCEACCTVYRGTGHKKSGKKRDPLPPEVEALLASDLALFSDPTVDDDLGMFARELNGHAALNAYERLFLSRTSKYVLFSPRQRRVICGIRLRLTLAGVLK